MYHMDYGWEVALVETKKVYAMAVCVCDICEDFIMVYTNRNFLMQNVRLRCALMMHLRFCVPQMYIFILLTRGWVVDSVSSFVISELLWF